MQNNIINRKIFFFLFPVILCCIWKYLWGNEIQYFLFMLVTLPVFTIFSCMTLDLNPLDSEIFLRASVQGSAIFLISLISALWFFFVMLLFYIFGYRDSNISAFLSIAIILASYLIIWFLFWPWYMICMFAQWEQGPAKIWYKLLPK